jgi:integrase
MKLYRRPESTLWYADVVHPVTGARIRRQLGTDNKKAATAALTALMADLQSEAAAALGGRRAITLEQALALYVQSLESEGKASASGTKATTLKTVGRNPNKPGLFALSPTMWLHDLTTADCERLVQARRAEGMAPQTIAHELKHVKAASRYVAVLKYRTPELLLEATSRNPWRRPKVPVKTRWLAPEEYRRLHTALDPYRDVVGRGGKPQRITEAQRELMREPLEFMVVLSLTGARTGEINRLRWDQIDTETWKAIRLWGNKGKKERLVPVTAAVAKVLQRRFTVRDPKQTLVFPGRYGDARQGSCLAILRAIQRCGLNAEPEIVARHGKATAHSLRHSFASWLIQDGAGLAEVQDVLGHSTIQMTRRYAHLAGQDTADKLASRLDQMGILRPS